MPNENDYLAEILGQTKAIAAGGGGVVIPSTTDLLKGNGSGGVSDSGIAPANVSLLSTLPADFATASAASPAHGSFDSIYMSQFTRIGWPGNAFISNYFVDSNILVLSGGNPTLTYIRVGTYGSTFSADVELVNSSAPATPTGGAVFYCISGQMHVLDVNAVDINLSLCLQPGSGWTANAIAGDKTRSVQNYTAIDFTTIDSGTFNTTFPGCASALNAISVQAAALTAKLAAIETALASSLYPNA